MFRFDEIDDDPSNRGKWFDKLVKVVEDVILPTQKAQSPSGAGATGVVRLQNTNAMEVDSVGTGDMMMWSKGAGKGSWRGQDSSYSGKGYGKDPWANWGYENDWSWYPERNWQMRGAYIGGWGVGKDQGKAIKDRGKALGKAIKGRGKALGKATRGRGKIQSEMGNPLTLCRRRRTALRHRVRNGTPSSRCMQRMVMINGLENLMDVLRKRIPRA